MTTTTTTTSAPAPVKRSPIVLIVNICVAVLMLASLPVIHLGQKRFAPHAEMDKEYVNAAISSGSAEFMHKALQTTEVARALAYESHLETMSLMQAGVVALAALFVLNSLFLARTLRAARGLSQPARVSSES